MTDSIPASTPTPSRRRLWPWIAGAAVLVVAAGGTALLWPSEEDHVVDACQDAIRAKLKSPTSAEFSDVKVDHVDGSSVYRIDGAIDSQNGFGAMVRGSYRCTMSTNSDGEWVATIAEVS